MFIQTRSLQSPVLKLCKTQSSQCAASLVRPALTDMTNITVSGKFPLRKRSMWMDMSVEQWQNDNDGVKQKCSERNLSQCNFVHHIYQHRWIGIALGPSLWKVDN